jgi:DNA polymerase-3 subunit alpha
LSVQCFGIAPIAYIKTVIYKELAFVVTTHFPMIHKQYPFRGRGVYLITGRVDIEFGFCSITVSGMEKLATVGRDDLSKS